MPVHVKWRSQKCPACGTQLLEVAGGLTGGVKIGSPLVECRNCGKISYTAMRREWYNYPNKDLLWLIPVVAAVGIGIIVSSGLGPLGVLMGAVVTAIAIGNGAVEAVRIVRSKRRMRDPAYLAELLRWRIIRQEEYEAFMRNARK